MEISIRPSRSDDGLAIQDIERLAGQRFRDIGLDRVADDEPETLTTLAHYATTGRGWVAVTDADEPVGYIIADDVDGNAHIEQMSVQPDRQGTGVGRALLDRARRWAIEQGKTAITLTTFVDVPWNRPLYEHLRFRVLAEDEIGPELRAVQQREGARGLDPRTRCCMCRDLKT